MKIIVLKCAIQYIKFQTIMRNYLVTLVQSFLHFWRLCCFCYCACSSPVHSIVFMFALPLLNSCFYGFCRSPCTVSRTLCSSSSAFCCIGTCMYAGMWLYSKQLLFFVCLLARYISNWSFYDIEFARCKRNNVKRVYLPFLAIR